MHLFICLFIIYLVLSYIYAGTKLKFLYFCTLANVANKV